MTIYQVIKTNSTNFHLFESLPEVLYPKGSERFRLGHEPNELFLQGCYVLLKNENPVGRFAFYENPELVYLNKNACTIGSYECENDSESSFKLIEFAKELAISKGYSWIIGPMEGSTWNSYRFSLNHDSPQYFMEPFHHLYYNNQFVEAGFEVIKSYNSNLVSASNIDAEIVKELEKLNNELGFTFRNIELDNYENELRKIAKLSLEGFSSNFLFTPISEEGLVAKYLKMKPFIDPNLIWMIEDGNKELHAYIFCVKDFFDSENRTIIFKTIVRKRESTLKSIGVYSIYKTNEMAIKSGCNKVIHALMSEDNFSSKESERNESKKYKEYALYGMKLEVGSTKSEVRRTEQKNSELPTSGFPLNVTNLFISAAKKFPATKAIVEIGTSISYFELEKEVLETAAYFQEKGIKKGDRVLVFVPMSIDLYRVVLALFYIGATAVFLDEWVSKKRLELCCELADCKGFIGVRKARVFSLFSKPLRNIPINLKLNGRSKSIIQQVEVDYDSSALITFTTGSTGTPKAANRSHGFLREQFNALIDEIDPSYEDIDLPVLPIVLFVNLGVGCTSVIADFKMSKLHKMKTQNIVNQITEHKVNRITSSPSFIHKLTHFVIDNKIELKNIEKIFTGGGPVFPEEASLFEKAFPNSDSKIVYGSTEAEPISSISAKKLKETDIAKGLPVGEVYHKTQLKIIPFTKESIPKTTEKELGELENEEGKIGEIIVAGNHVLKSYFNNPKAFEKNKIVTEETIWHRTGDCGFIENGQLFLLGRCEQVIKHQNKVYSPFVIEHQLKQINGIETGTVLFLNNEMTLVIESTLSQNETQKELSFLGIENIKILKKISRDPRHHTKIDYGKLKEMIS